jgi:hypothetical protein
MAGGIEQYPESNRKSRSTPIGEKIEREFLVPDQIGEICHILIDVELE